MSVKQDFSGQYSPKQDELLLFEGGKASSIILMLKGKIDVYLSPFEDILNNEQLILARSCRLFTLERNTFLGVNDILRNGQSLFSLKAKDGCALYCFPAASVADVKNILSAQKDYSAYLVTSLATLIDLSNTAYQRLFPVYRSINSLMQNLSIYYWAIKDKYNFASTADMAVPKAYEDIYEELKKDNYTFFPVDVDNLAAHPICQISDENNSEPDLGTIEYFSSILNVPMDNRKGFFNSDTYVCEYHIRKGSEILDSIVAGIKDILSKLVTDLEHLYQPPNNLISTYGKIALELKEDREAALTLLKILTKAVDEMVLSLNKLQDEFDFLKSVDSKELIGLLAGVQEKLTVNASLEVEAENSFDLPDELDNSLEKILDYCKCTAEIRDNFKKMINKFKSIKDKTSLSSEERALREAITTDFFTMYEEAFKRAKSEKSTPKLISMFLNFGYMDERLVTREQAIALYRLCDKDYRYSDFSFYSAEKWLEMIYQNKKDPSINEFGQDYSDVFREMKKRREVTDADKAKYDGDVEAKLNFEISNMLKTNQKVCHGHMSSYFPILHKDIITRDLEKAVVTPAKLEKAFNDLMGIDFSVFYREIWYKNDQKGIEKEPIMLEVRPDIIIIPAFGSRASMWQEIAGRNRSAPGRFIVPAFTDEDLGKLVLKLFGSFRWELCRTMAGVAWNDITEKSLTSEYTDYIQFYRNNSELSEDAKEKIKEQIQRYRSMMREIFTSDYENWINYESQGIQRLNKIARSIMMRYCPPPKETRNSLAKHPAFSDLAAQVNYLRDKTAKSLTGRYAKIFKNGPMDRDMELNLKFYRDM